MSTLCPPPSPAVAKTEIALSGESPLLAATFAYWDNILGPRVRHIWAPKTEQVLLSDGEITFLANHTLNGEILRNAESGAIDVKFFVLSEKGVTMSFPSFLMSTFRSYTTGVIYLRSHARLISKPPLWAP